jgi:hypothetical protein
LPRSSLFFPYDILRKPEGLWKAALLVLSDIVLFFQAIKDVFQIVHSLFLAQSRAFVLLKCGVFMEDLPARTDELRPFFVFGLLLKK